MPVGRTANFIEGFKSFETSNTDDINTQMRNIDYFADTNNAEEIIVNDTKNIKIKCSQDNTSKKVMPTKVSKSEPTKNSNSNKNETTETTRNTRNTRNTSNTSNTSNTDMISNTDMTSNNTEEFEDADDNTDDEDDSILLGDDTDKYREIRPTEPDNELIIEGFSGSMIGGNGQLRKILIAILIVFVVYLLNHNKSLAFLAKLITNFSKNREVVNGIILFFIIWVIINIL
jgi:hypothetical protein